MGVGIARFFRRIAFAVRARRHAADLAAELEEHRTRVQARLEAGGVPFSEAAARSRRAMGNVTLAREDARDIWIFPVLERAWRDAIYGARALRREPAFALAAALTLTLGIATTTTVFSVVDAELWKPLPLRDPHELFDVQVQKAGGRYDYVSGPEFVDWRVQSRLARYIATTSPARRTLRLDGGAESVTVRPITVDFLDVLGAAPRIGHGFASEDEHAPRVMILSDTGWTRLFNRDPSAAGRTVVLDDEPYTIIGITAGTRFEFTSDPDVFVPLDLSAMPFRDRTVRTLELFGRLLPSVPIGSAQAELQSLAGRSAALVPDDQPDRSVRLVDLQHAASGFNWREMYFFLGAAGLVLVLSCLNVAGLLLSRALRRQREFAIRGALGGGRSALVRQLIVEGALLAVPGAGAGTLLSIWALAFLSLHIPPGHLERGGHIQLDLRVGAFVLALCAVSTLLLALTPLVFARRVNLNVMLGQSGRAIGPSPQQRRTRVALLIAQVMATLVLLAGAALFTLSFIRLARTPLGFDPSDRAALRLSLSGARYAKDAAIAGFSDRLIGEARGLAGVREVAVGSSSPLDNRGGPAVQIVVPGRPRPPRGQEPTALIKSASPHYFRALGIRQVSGRAFTDGDAAGAPRVAIVNELLVQRIFAGQDAVGRELELLPRVRSGWTNRPGRVLIVGVVSNVRNFGINEVEFSSVYLPFAQAPAPAFELLLATSIPIADAIGPLRAAVRRVDSGLPVLGVTTLADRVDTALGGDRFNLLVVAFFAAAAALLSGVGIYGAIACSVQERTREFGVRMALGARPRSILGASLVTAVRIGVIGSALGAVMTLALARLLGNALYLVPGEHGGMLYRVKTTDPLALAAACGLLLAVVAVAGLIPARQATRIDPLVALRAE